jgi:hypothetical protein
MTRRHSLILVFVGFLALGIGALLTYVNAPLPNHGFTDAAAAIAVISASSVGIERAIEMLWIALGSFVGEWWPLNIVNGQVAALTDDLDPVVASFYGSASSALEVAKAKGQLTATGLAKAQAELTAQQTALTARLAELKVLAPDSQRAHLLATTVGQSVALVAANYASFSDDVQRAVNVANQSVVGLSDFVATLKDNPSKRLISLWIGMLFGLAVAGFLGLDVFVAVLGTAVPSVPLPADPAGIVMTGLVIGLGASPTHEVIGVLQEIKKARTTDNQPSPDLAG